MELQEYYKGRHSYAIIDGKLVWASDENCDGISTHDWLVGRRGMNESQYDETIRGTIYENRVVICRGLDYNSVDIDALPDGILNAVVNKAGEVFGCSSIVVHNGSVMGEPGTDWEPRINLGSFSCGL